MNVVDSQKKKTWLWEFEGELPQLKTVVMDVDVK